MTHSAQNKRVYAEYCVVLHLQIPQPFQANELLGDEIKVVFVEIQMYQALQLVESFWDARQLVIL